MQENTEMRWLIDPFTRRRMNDQLMECARAALPEVMKRMPDGPIDAKAIAEASMAIATTMVAEFAKRDLI